jgi:hypothetical protein
MGYGSNIFRMERERKMHTNKLNVKYIVAFSIPFSLYERRPRPWNVPRDVWRAPQARLSKQPCKQVHWKNLLNHTRILSMLPFFLDFNLACFSAAPAERALPDEFKLNATPLRCPKPYPGVPTAKKTYTKTIQKVSSRLSVPTVTCTSRRLFLHGSAGLGPADFIRVSHPLSCWCFIATLQGLVIGVSIRRQGMQ